MDTILSQNYADAASVNPLVSRNRKRWEFLYDSFSGGETYRKGAYLTRYQLETPNEYAQRLDNTPYDNHPRSIISTYISFLFRTEPERTLTGLEGDPALIQFLEDSDHEGRDLDSFMKQAATWANVFGHTWIIMSKANVGAITRADELAAGVRPYLNLLSPLVVTDFAWTRLASGRYELSYFKYIEDSNSSVTVVKEWTPEFIQTTMISHEKQEVKNKSIEINQLGIIPAVILYNQTSTIRGIGISSVEDIADASRMIYNLTSEVEQGIRLGSHPSLVTTPDTNVGSGAGALIHMPQNLDPALKPYVLEFSGQEVASIYTAINNIAGSIDKMANTGSIRASEAQTMSGVSREVEFQLLNSRLSEMADNIELAEEQLWKLYAKYQNLTWAGEIEYPDSFAIHDTQNELDQLIKTYSTIDDPAVKDAIKNDIVELLGIEVVATEVTGNGCPIAMTDKATNIANHKICVTEANLGPARPSTPGTYWMVRADRLGITEAVSKTQTCSNCGYYYNTPEIKQCYSTNNAAGNIPLATEVNPAWENVPNPAGYCEKWDITCTPTRTCDTWIAGGPIV